jgi:DNA-binding Xre family transcriptional regulator
MVHKRKRVKKKVQRFEMSEMNLLTVAFDDMQNIPLPKLPVQELPLNSLLLLCSAFMP